MSNTRFRSNESLVTIHNQQPITTSLLVAQKFGKRHGDILRSVSKINSANAKVRLLYYSTTYKDEQAKDRPMYLMNKDGFVLLVMGFTGPQALAFKIDYFNAFNAMEAKLREQPDPTRYVPITQYREQVRLAEFERREAETWYKRSQAYLSLLEKSASNQAKLSEAMLSLSKSSVPLAPKPSEWMTVVGYASLHDIPCSLSMAGALGRKAAVLCSKQGITPHTIPDPRFGRVNTYPTEILRRVFEQ